MTARSKLRGHEIELINGEWVYSDIRKSTVDTYAERDCGHCSKSTTPEGHDAFLGVLKGVMNTCCGHGSAEEAYVQLLDGSCVRGNDAVVMFDILKRAV